MYMQHGKEIGESTALRQHGTDIFLQMASRFNRALSPRMGGISGTIHETGTNGGDDVDELAFVLSLLDSKQDTDFWGAKNVPSVGGILKAIENKSGVQENILFSSTVSKINHRKAVQTRVIIVTDVAIYNLSTNGKVLKRRIPLETVSAIVLSETGEDFIFHIPSSYDYWIRTPRRTAIVRTVVAARERVSKSPIDFSVVPLNRIAGSVVLKESKNGSSPVVTPKVATSNYLSRVIRQKVSKKKKRFQEDGFDLDLSFITDRVIAMGYPSEDVEGLYRNPALEVVRFFDARFPERYMVINLCSERRYDASLFHRRVALFPFDDHNCPEFVMMIEFCKCVDDWLAQDPDNVVAVHCKAGKGRTGLMIAAYLQYAGICKSADEALAFFADKRTLDGKGVTIPSQKRFVGYFGEFLSLYMQKDNPFPEHARPITLSGIRMCTVPHFDSDGGCDPYFTVQDATGHVHYDSRTGRQIQHVSYQKHAESQEIEIQMDPHIFRGTLKFTFYDQDEYSFDDKMFQLWINTDFLHGSQLSMDKMDIDSACKDKKHKEFDERFSVHLSFHDSTEEELALEDHMDNPLETTSVESALQRLTSLQTDMATKQRYIESLLVQNTELQEEVQRLSARGNDGSIGIDNDESSEDEQ